MRRRNLADRYLPIVMQFSYFLGLVLSKMLEVYGVRRKRNSI